MDSLTAIETFFFLRTPGCGEKLADIYPVLNAIAGKCCTNCKRHEVTVTIEKEREL